MSRRDNAKVRCARCRLHLSLCVCSQLPRIATRTRLLVVVHKLEERKPTNTGRLAALCLANSEMLVRGREGGDAPPSWPDDSQPLLLFPAEDAVPITSFASGPRPVTLIVPDGNWRQAAKVRARTPGLAGVPVVSLPSGPPTAYLLRNETRDGGLATLEAIARAFGALEGKDVQRELERVLALVVARTRWARGAISEEAAALALPDGRMRHDPLSGVASPAMTATSEMPS